MSAPERIRSIAVHREDVATALEATLRTDRRVVLRVTPPFSGRMRARLHEAGGDPADGSGPGSTRAPLSGVRPDGTIHVDPRDLVADVPPYPEADDTAAAHPDADVEVRRDRHAETVSAWRERARRGVVGSVVLELEAGTRSVDVVALG